MSRGALLLVGIGLGLVAGCLLLSGTAAAAEHAVSMGDRFFSPATVRIAVGDTVVWTNADEDPHTATSIPAGRFDSGNMERGDVFRHTFTAEGTFNYVCVYHGRMTGSVVVGNGGTGTGQPGGNGSTGNDPGGTPGGGGGGTNTTTPPRGDAPPPGDASSVPPPQVTLDLTGLDKPLLGRVVLRGTTTSPSGAAPIVEVQVDDGPWQRASGGTSWEFTWDTRGVTAGNHIVAVRATLGDATSPVLWQNVVVADAALAEDTTGARDTRTDQAPAGFALFVLATVGLGAAAAVGTVAIWRASLRRRLGP